jgi:phosphatidylethanolamine/phosphatidyl-N-methylethanolamine N-methyltransferase
MLRADLRLFLYNWLRAPLQTGAFVPSGGPLARVMAAQVDPHQAGAVVELGAGTGVVTKALLERGITADRLMIIERNPAFCKLLQRRFPEVTILQGDARCLGGLLKFCGVDQVGTVVSSLPLLSLPFSTRRNILRESVRVLDVEGSIIQFTYGRGSPVHPVLQRRLELDGRAVARVWRNLPPAVVWRYRLADSPQRGAGRLAA